MKEAKLFKQDIAIQAILYILERMGGTCDIHKCHKILYFADNEHLSKYGRSITGDAYVRMEFGPVPTCIYDLLKAVRGDSCSLPDMSYLSESDVEMLDKYVEQFKNKSFEEISEASHGYAWSHTAQNGVISVRDRLTEMGDSDEYIRYIEEQMRAEEAVLLGELRLAERLSADGETLYDLNPKS